MTEPRFTRIGSRERVKGHIFSVVTAQFRDHRTGEIFDRDLIHHPGAVGVAPLHEDGSLTLVRQYRPALGHDLLEIPAGVRDVDGEAPERTAARELAEEVGLTAEQIEPLSRFHNAAGYADEVIELFVARGLSQGASSAQSPEEEAMVVERHPLSRLVDMVLDCEITDVKTIIAILLLARD